MKASCGLICLFYCVHRLHAFSPPLLQKDRFLRPSTAGNPLKTTKARTTTNRNASSKVQEQSNNKLSQEQRRKESLDVGHNPLLSLNINLDALARAEAPERAQELYQRISALHREGYYAVQPDIVSFNSVLKAWSQKSDPVSALEFWEAEASHLKMNVRSYNTFLLALARNGMHKQAHTLLQQMQVVNAAVRPDRISWNTVLLAYATSAAIDDDNDNDAALQAEELLKEMIHRHEGDSKQNDTNVQNESDLLNLPPVIDPHYIPPAPDATSYNTVISAWAMYSNVTLGLERAEYWLHEMERYSDPDVYTYTTILNAWKRCEDGEVAVQRVQEILDNMCVPPNQVTYTIVMQCLCQNYQPEKANDILQYMIKSNVQPDRVAFSALMDGWAAYAKRENNEEAGEKAVAAVFDLLRQMKSLSKKNPDATPSEITYTCMLKTIAAAKPKDAVIMARRVLSEMTWTPSTIHYNAALDCCAKASRATKGIDAARLWRDMVRHGVQCDTITYNTVLCAVSNSYGSKELKERSIRVGFQAFEKLQNDSHLVPTSLTYNYYFKMFRRLMPSSSERRAHVMTGFKLCCKQGCMNHVISKQILQMPECKDIIPPINQWKKEWSRNSMKMRKQ